MSSSGYLWHDGHHYFVGEVFAGKQLALHQSCEGTTELHFANLHLGNLNYEPEVARFRPPAYIARPPIPPSQPPEPSLDYQIYLDQVAPMSPDSLSPRSGSYPLAQTPVKRGLGEFYQF